MNCVEKEPIASRDKNKFSQKIRDTRRRSKEWTKKILN